MLCVLLLENGLDYKSNDDLDNMINALDYQREVRFKTNHIIPDWAWTAIVGPVVLLLFRFIGNLIAIVLKMIL